MLHRCQLWRLNIIKPECVAEFSRQFLPESRLATCSPESYSEEKSPRMCACINGHSHFMYLGRCLDVKLQLFLNNSLLICLKPSTTFTDLTVPPYVHFVGCVGPWSLSQLTSLVDEMSLQCLPCVCICRTMSMAQLMSETIPAFQKCSEYGFVCILHDSIIRHLHKYFRGYFSVPYIMCSKVPDGPDLP